MSIPKHFAASALLLLGLQSVAASSADRTGSLRPEAVSPGRLDRIVEMGDGCFGYSWSTLEGARGFELAVHRVDGVAAGVETAATPPALRVRVPATLSWTPSLEECLPPGRYGWVVRAETAAGWTEWSEPRLFEVRRSAPGAPPTVPPEHPEAVGSLGGLSPAIAELQTAGTERLFTPVPQRPRPLAGAAFSPPGCDRGRFSDVAPDSPYCAWIEQITRDEIALPCESGLGGPERYCPDHPVTRGQIAMLLERVMRGTNKWRPEQGDGALPNLPPAPSDPHLLFSPTHSNDVGKHTSITVGSDGLGLISYYDAGYHLLKVAHCLNLNCTEATIPYLNFDTDSGQYSSIAIGVDGLGLISYYDNTSHDLAVIHCRNLDCTSVDGAFLDTAGDVGQYSSIAIGADGLGIISYYAVISGIPVPKVAHCADLHCSTADSINIIFDYYTGQYGAITIGYDGFPLISYYDSANTALRVAHCTTFTCSGVESPLPLDATAGQTSITVGTDGLGLISYRDPAGGLAVAHCPTTRCNTFPTTTTLDPGNVGESSITIGADGLGLVSYYDATNQALKVAHCNNTACTSATINQVEGGGVGKYNSITIGADGLGLISYYDEYHGSIKVAHCSNVLCAPYFRRR